jgi:carotenoid cleavage dioxygenase-like enzyme
MLLPVSAGPCFRKLSSQRPLTSRRQPSRQAKSVPSLLSRNMAASAVASAEVRSSQHTDLAGPFTTVAESPTPTPLAVSGTLPPYLNGTLLRNGPGAFEHLHADGSSTPVRHWFDGTSMLHGFAIDGRAGTVSYRSRVTAQGVVRTAKAAPSAQKYRPRVMFGVQDPCKSTLAKVFAMFLSSNVDPETGRAPLNVGVTLQKLPGFDGLMSRTDNAAMFSFDKETLEVSEFTNWNAVTVTETDDGEGDRKLSGMMSAAHGVLDAARDEYFNFTFDFGRDVVTYNVFRLDTSGRAQILAEVRDRAAYVHSLAATEHYVVLIVYPLYINGLRVLFEKSLVGGLSFDPSAQTRFHVVSRASKKVVAEYTAPASWAFHVVNAFEDSGGNVQIDLSLYSTGDVVKQLTVENLRTKASGFFDKARVARYTLPSPGSVDGTGGEQAAGYRELSSTSLELPRINDAYNMKPYKFAYGVQIGGDEDSALPPFSMLCKVDVEAGTTVSYTRPRTFFSEPIFVADPDGDDEDAGCVVAVAYDAGSEKSHLLVLDARSFEEVARAQCVGMVTAGFHGAFAA